MSDGAAEEVVRGTAAAINAAVAVVTVEGAIGDESEDEQNDDDRDESLCW